MKTSIKIKLTMLFLLSANFTFSQEAIEDSLISRMCEDLPTYKKLDKREIGPTIFDKHLTKYLETKKLSKRDSISISIDQRLQRKCPDYIKILDKIHKPKRGNWTYLKNIPKSRITDKQIDEFKNTQSFYYIKKSGSEVPVKIENNQWIDLLPNNTYSKLDLEWLTNTSFQLKFIESNNLHHKGSSRKGDIYKYNIIERKKNYYLLVLTTPQNTSIVSFKFYPKLE